MRAFDTTSPFLNSVVEALRSAGGPTETVFRSGGQELLYIPWFPDLPNGLIMFDVENSKWEQWEPSPNHENLIIDFRDDNCLRIRQGDDDPVWLETNLKAGDELLELTEFYIKTEVSKIGTSSRSPKPLSLIIEDTFLLIPQPKGHPKPFRLRGLEFARAQPQIAAVVDTWMTNAPLTIHTDFGTWLDETGHREAVNQTEELRLGDLILTPRNEVHYAGMMVLGADSFLGYNPALVLRPKEDTSRMWLVDYLEHAAEAEGLIQRLCNNWKRLPKDLTQIMIPIPSAKRDQVADAIERRSARQAYLGFLKAAMRIREPFEQVAKIYQKRTRAAQGLHTELLDDLVAMQHPLPFFLEYPYRAFRKEDDHIRKVTAGQRLLGVLAKVPLFLVVEELLSADHPLGHEVLQRLQEAPPSDGTLVRLHREVSEQLIEDPSNPLILFKELLGFLRANERLMSLVEARNRMHHEPFDQFGFLKAVDEVAPTVLDTLRGLLAGCRFLIPTHTQVINGEKSLTAEEISGADAQFRTAVIKITLPLERFQTGQLIALRNSPECVLPLGSLLTATTINQQSRDFGIFDRMENQTPRFAYVRSD